MTYQLWMSKISVGDNRRMISIQSLKSPIFLTATWPKAEILPKIFPGNIPARSPAKGRAGGVSRQGHGPDGASRVLRSRKRCVKLLSAIDGVACFRVFFRSVLSPFALHFEQT
jgi:hypothetical protein